MTQAEVHVRKTPVEQVYGRKVALKTKSTRATRARSPTKRDTSPKRPWIPSPGRSTLRDKRGDLKWDENGMGDAGAPQTHNAKKQQHGQGGQLRHTASDTQIFELLDQVIELKSRLGKRDIELIKERDINKTLSEEIVDRAENTNPDATGNGLPLDDDIYTEIQSDVHPHQVPEIQKVVDDTKLDMYSSIRERSGDSERAALQKLLVEAELDLKTLDFKNPDAVDRFLMSSRDIRVKMNAMKVANFDVQRLEEQRDAVVDRLVKTDSECAIAKSELRHKDADLAGLRVDTEIEREKTLRLNEKVAHLEEVKARIQRELYSREGELNRTQARERVVKKQLVESNALLEAEKASNGKHRLDQEKQALKRACRHHKTKAEMLKLQNDELALDLKRSHHELAAWKDRSIRNCAEAEESTINHKRHERDLQYKNEKLISLEHQNDLKEDTITSQSKEISSLKIALADAKAQVQELVLNKDRELDLAREDAMGSMAALKDLPQELRMAHQRLDEALGEIRSLEETNSDLQFQLDRTAKQLILTEQNESEMKIYHNKLSAAEIRLDEVQKALEETTEELDIARNETHQWRLRADERQQTINALQRQLEAGQAEARRTLVAEREKFEIKERSLQTKLGDNELELTRQKGELSATKRQKEDIEARAEHTSNDLRDRLEHAEATNRSMQSYVNFLKTSYTSTFGELDD